MILKWNLGKNLFFIIIKNYLSIGELYKDLCTRKIQKRFSINITDFYFHITDLGLFIGKYTLFTIWDWFWNWILEKCLYLSLEEIFKDHCIRKTQWSVFIHRTDFYFHWTDSNHWLTIVICKTSEKLICILRHHKSEYLLIFSPNPVILITV